MSEKPGYLWAVIQEWIDAQPYRVTQRQLAPRVGVGHSTVTDWKYARTQPSPAALKALAVEIGVPYEKVLNAMLIDHGYRDAPADELGRSVRQRLKPLEKYAKAAEIEDDTPTSGSA